MSKKVKVTKGIFDGVKLLTKVGASIEECAEYMGVSHATVSRIRSAESFEDFQQARRVAAIAAQKRNQEKKAQQEAKQEKPVEQPVEKPVEELKLPQTIDSKQNVTMIASYHLVDEMKKQTEMLKLISNKLAFIVEQLA